MDCNSNEDLEITRIIARFVSIRNSCSIIRCFSIEIVSMLSKFEFRMPKRVFDSSQRARFHS